MRFSISLTNRSRRLRSSLLPALLVATVAAGTPLTPGAARAQAGADLEGLPVVSITVDGLVRVDEDVVLRRLELRIGGPWRTDLARRDERAVSALAVFWAVRVQGEPATAGDGSAGVAVHVALEERFAWFAVPQFDWTEEEGWSWGASAGHLNVGGRGHRLFLTAMAGGRRAAVLRSKNRLYDFKETGERVTGQWSRWFGDIGRFAAGFRYQRVGSDRPGVTLSSATEDRLHLAWAYLGLATGDPWAHPRLGLVAGLTAEGYGGPLGGDLEGATVTASVSLHHPLARDLVWASMGRVITTGGDVPFWRLLSLGGAYTVRGYALGEYLVQRRWDASSELQWYAVPMRVHDLGGLGEQILGMSLSVLLDAGIGYDVRRAPGAGPPDKESPLLLSWGVGATFHNAMFGNLRLEVAWPDRGKPAFVFRIGSKL